MDTSKILLFVCLCFLGLCIVPSMSTDPLTLSVEDLKKVYEAIGWGPDKDWTEKELYEGYGVAVAIHLRLQEANIQKTNKTYWFLSRQGNGLNCLRAMYFLGNLGYSHIEGVLLPTSSAPVSVLPNVLQSARTAGSVINEAETPEAIPNFLPNADTIDTYAAYFECIGATAIRDTIEPKAIYVLDFFKKLEKYNSIQTFAMDVPFYWNEEYGINVSDTDSTRDARLYIPNHIIAVGKFKEYQSNSLYSGITHTLVEIDKVNKQAEVDVESKALTAINVEGPANYKLFIARKEKMLPNNLPSMVTALRSEVWTQEKETAKDVTLT